MTTVEMARLTVVDAKGKPKSKPIVAHFNPQSLQITYEVEGASGNASTARGAARGARAGATSQSTGYKAKLSSLSLQFDTTQQGEDVRKITLEIAKTMLPTGSTSAPTVEFQWGTFLFSGKISGMQETLEYFSAQGVPLRATVQLTMEMVETVKKSNDEASNPAPAGKSSSQVSNSGGSAGSAAGIAAQGHNAKAAGTTAFTGPQAGEPLQKFAARSGDDWKKIAAANGIDNPRQMQPGKLINPHIKTSGS
jgi:hypothetical protein